MTTATNTVTAYLIDPVCEQIIVMDIDPDAQKMATMLYAKTLQSVDIGCARATLYVSREALTGDDLTQQRFFTVSGIAQAMAGRGLVIGLDDKCNLLPEPGCTRNELANRVQWLTPHEILRLVCRNG